MTTPVEKTGVALLAGGASVSVSGGLWLKWLAENHQAIGSIGVIVGIVLGIAGFCVNWWYQRKRSQYPWRG